MSAYIEVRAGELAKWLRGEYSLSLVVHPKDAPSQLMMSQHRVSRFEKALRTVDAVYAELLYQRQRRLCEAVTAGLMPSNFSKWLTSLPASTHG